MYFLIVHCLLAGFTQAAERIAIDPAANQAAEVVSRGASVDSVHPLLLGSPVDPGSPLSRAVERHAAIIQQEPATASAHLARVSQEGPVARAAAGFISRVIGDPHAAQIVRRHAVLSSTHLGALAARMATADHGIDLEGMGPLIEAARDERAVVDFFDNGLEYPSLELEEAQGSDEGIHLEGAQLARLGQGAYGTVEVHPSIPGVVVKTPRLSIYVMEKDQWQAVLDETARADARLTEKLGSVGVGPRLLGVTHPLLHPPLPDPTGRGSGLTRKSTVKEQVFGETVQELIRRRNFTRLKYELVMDLLRRMFREGITGGDLNGGNFMIGHTLLDRTMRALFVDGADDTQPPPLRFEDLYHYETKLHSGKERLSDMLENGLDRTEGYPFNVAMHPLLLGVRGDVGSPRFELEGLTATPLRGVEIDGVPVRSLYPTLTDPVVVHPGIPGVVIKVIFDDAERALEPHRGLTVDDNEKWSHFWARAGIGPRLLGRTELPNNNGSRTYPTLLKERVYGETLPQLIKGKEFTQECYDLVLDLLERMVGLGIGFSSLMGPKHIMIGHTPSDPIRRAYLVNGGNGLVPSAGIDELLHHQVRELTGTHYFHPRRLVDVLDSGLQESDDAR